MERWYSLQGLSAPQDPKATFQAKTWLLSAQYRHDSSQPWLKSHYTYHFKSTWVRHVCRHVHMAVHASTIYLFDIQSMQQVLCFQQHFVACRVFLPCNSQKSPVYQKLLFYSMFFTIWKIPFNNILHVDEGSQSENSVLIISYGKYDTKGPLYTYKHWSHHTRCHSLGDEPQEAVVLPLQPKGPKTSKQHSEGDV